MSDFDKAPLENQFETQIVGEISSGATVPFNINVKKAISFTPDSGGFRAVLEPGTSKEEGMIITAVSGTTWTVGTRGVPIAKGGTSTTTTHGGGVKIIITDTWSTFDDIATAVETKLDKAGGTVSAFDLQSSTSNFRIRDDAGDMKLTDDNNAELTLTTLAAAAGVDQKARVSVADTTSGFLQDKVTAGEGLTGTITSPAGNEAWDLDVDTTDTTTFVKTSSGAGDEDKVPVLNASGQLATGFIEPLEKLTGYFTKTFTPSAASSNQDTAIATVGTAQTIVFDVFIGGNAPSDYRGIGRYAYNGSTIAYSYRTVGDSVTSITFGLLSGTASDNMSNTALSWVLGTGGNDQTVTFSIQNLTSTGFDLRVTNTKNGTGAITDPTIKIGYTVIV